MKKYLTFFTLHLNNALEYRAATLSWITVELLTLTSAIFLWSGAFQTRLNVGSYKQNDIMLYYFFIPVVGMISGSFITDWLPKRIKDGDITKDILKPYSFPLSILVSHLANRCTQALFKLPVYIGVGLMLALIIKVDFHGSTIIAGLSLALFALLMNLLMDLSISFLSFWFDDSWSLSLLKTASFLLLGGMSFPINLAPYPFQSILEWLPFHLVYYLPVAIIIGQVPISALYLGIFKCLAWGMVFLFTLKYIWHRGLKKYSAYGQ